MTACPHHPHGDSPEHSDSRKRVLFVCTYNSVRSRMAEGILRHLYGDSYEVASAGLAPAGFSIYGRKVLREAGVDISNHHSKALQSLPREAYDLIVTICDQAMGSGRFVKGCGSGYQTSSAPGLPGRVIFHPGSSLHSGPGKSGDIPGVSRGSAHKSTTNI